MFMSTITTAKWCNINALWFVCMVFKNRAYRVWNCPYNENARTQGLALLRSARNLTKQSGDDAHEKWLLFTSQVGDTNECWGKQGNVQFPCRAVLPPHAAVQFAQDDPPPPPNLNEKPDTW